MQETIKPADIGKKLGVIGIKILKYLFLGVNIFAMFFPLVFMLLSATKSHLEIYSDPFGLPANIGKSMITNFLNAFNGTAGNVQNTPFLTLLFNTSFLTFATLILMIVVSMLAGYAMARWNFKFKTTFLMYVLIIQTVPFFGYMKPMLQYGQWLHITESLIGILPVYVGVSAPTAIILFKSFYSAFPVAVEEAAYIDGCNEFNKFVRIILPMSKGIVASMVIVNFMGYWNETVIASLFLTQEQHTFSVAILSSVTISGGATDLGYNMALLVLAAIPNLVFFTIFSKGIMGGISLGAIKG